MGLLRYSEGELREMLRRAVRIRWPTEDLVIMTDCQADPPRGNPLIGPDETPDRHLSTGCGSSHAVLGATRSRLIYQERTTHAILLRSMAVILGVVAVAALFFGPGLLTFAAIGVAGLALWSLAKLAELFTVGGTSIEFGQVERVDRLTQRIEGRGGSGTTYRLVVPDPSDFGLIVSLVDSDGRAA
jgi:hypothetical protein